MSKEFYTEKDIEDLFQRGIRSLQVTENVVLTELAYEKANRLGLQLVSDRADNPPAAPIRPYLTEAATVRSQPAAAALSPSEPVRPARFAKHIEPQDPQSTEAHANTVEQRIRSAVIAKLGDQV